VLDLVGVTDPSVERIEGERGADAEEEPEQHPEQRGTRRIRLDLAGIVGGSDQAQPTQPASPSTQLTIQYMSRLLATLASTRSASGRAPTLAKHSNASTVLLTLSGRGDKDANQVAEMLTGEALS